MYIFILKTIITHAAIIKIFRLNSDYGMGLGAWAWGLGHAAWSMASLSVCLMAIESLHSLGAGQREHVLSIMYERRH